MADHIPDPGRHRTLFYAHYANRARGARAKERELHEGPGIPDPRETSLLSHLGAADQQGVPRRPAHVSAVRGPAPDRGLHPRSLHDQEDPRPPGPQPARDRAAASRRPLRPPRSRGKRARAHGGRENALALARRGEARGASDKPWCDALCRPGTLRGLPAPTRGELRGAAPCRAPRASRTGPARPAAIVVTAPGRNEMPIGFGLARRYNSRPDPHGAPTPRIHWRR